MCSILTAFDLRPAPTCTPLRPLALSLSARQRHRGPDWSGVHAEPRAMLVHERLAIVDPAGGAQPLRSADGALVLAVNGEIYNHRELRARTRAAVRVPDRLGLRSDQRAVPRSTARPASAKLNGMFAFALWDAAKAIRDRARSDRHHPAVLGPRRRRPPVGRLGDEGAGARLRGRVANSRPAITTTARSANWCATTTGRGATTTRSRASRVDPQRCAPRSRAPCTAS